MYRQTVEYKRKRSQQRKALTEKRQRYKTDHRYKYKGETGGKARCSSAAEGKGAVRACTCTAACQRACPCRAAGAMCTELCHPASTRCMNGGRGAEADAHAHCSGASSSRDHAAAEPNASHGGAAAACLRPQCSPPEDGEDLTDRSLMCYWDGAGWLQGTVVEANTDDAELDGEDVANWLVYYSCDDTTAAHYLTRDFYCSAAADKSSSFAGQGAWYLLVECAK